jgi:hypothetical protein
MDRKIFYRVLNQAIIELEKKKKIDPENFNIGSQRQKHVAPANNNYYGHVMWQIMSTSQPPAHLMHQLVGWNSGNQQQWMKHAIDVRVQKVQTQNPTPPHTVKFLDQVHISVTVEGEAKFQQVILGPKSENHPTIKKLRKFMRSMAQFEFNKNMIELDKKLAILNSDRIDNILIGDKV